MSNWTKISLTSNIIKTDCTVSYLDHFRLLKECNVLISKAFRGQLVISEFDEFIFDIKGIYDMCAPNMAGKPATYIPQLARGDPAMWAVSLCTIDGQRFHIGDVNDRFSIQSTRLVRILTRDLT